MLICIDARNIKDTPSGLGNYASCLIKALMDLDSKNKYIVILNSKLKESFHFNDNFNIIRINYDIVSPLNIFLAHRVINRLRPDVYHSFHAFIPFFLNKNIKTILTIHDLKQLIIPKISQKSFFRSLIVNTFYKLFNRPSLKLASKIIAISQTTADDLKNLYGLQFVNKTITITHSLADINDKLQTLNSKSEELFVSKTIQTFIHNNKYILCLGNSKPHKNVDSCIKVIETLKKNKILSNLKLTIVGRDDRKDILAELVNKLDLKNEIHFFHNTNDAERNMFYENALFLAFPSKFEGLGMPILEAFKFNLPVLTSNITATKEISGDATLLVNPYNIDSIYDGFKELIQNNELRNTLVHKGKERLKDFSWEVYAKKVHDLYVK